MSFHLNSVENKREGKLMLKLVCGRIDEMPYYAPQGHADTKNRRLLGPFNGCNDVEVIIGEMGRTGVASTHTHQDFDQITIILEGQLRCITPYEDVVSGPGEFSMIPRGLEHTAYCISEHSRFVLIYAPPRQK